MTLQSSDIDIIVLAAGRGIRMCSETPKALHLLCGVSIIERIIQAACGAKPGRIIIVVGFRADLMNKELEHIKSLSWAKDIEICAVLQEELLGTGYAVKVAIPAMRKDAKAAMILPGDCPLITTDALVNLRNGHKPHSAITILSGYPVSPNGFGRIIRDPSGAVQAITEDKDCTLTQRQINEVNTAIYVVESGFLAESLKNLKTDNAQQEYYLTDIVGLATKGGLAAEALVIPDFSLAQGVNSRFELNEVENILRGRMIRSFMDNGVTFENTANVIIENEVCIGPDTFIGSGVRLKGNSVIEPNVVIEGDAVINNALIETGARIGYFSIINDSTISAYQVIEPHSRVEQNKLL